MHRWIAATAVVLLLAGGCQREGTRAHVYRTRAEDPGRDTETARRENGKAVGLIKEGNLEEAETVLRSALTADLFFAPAHNNLGVVYYRQNAFYRAAWEFQYAARLMPHSPQPRNNLGLVYEAVGRLAEAEKWFDEALALAPDNPELIGNLARVRVRSGERNHRTRTLLEDLVLKTEDAQWADWARRQLAVMPRGETPETPAASPGTEEGPSAHRTAEDGEPSGEDEPEDSRPAPNPPADAGPNATDAPVAKDPPTLAP